MEYLLAALLLYIIYLTYSNEDKKKLNFLKEESKYKKKFNIFKFERTLLIIILITISITSGMEIFKL